MTNTLSTPPLVRLTSAELSLGQLFLEQTRDGLTGSARMLTPAQWTFKPRPERWSIGEIVEHVIAVQERVIGMIRQHLASAPPPPSEQDHELVDGIVIHQIWTPCCRSCWRTRRLHGACRTISETVTETPPCRTCEKL